MRDASVVATVLLSLCLSCPAQSAQKISLDIGSVTVYVGMLRGDIVERCATTGYKRFGGDKNTITFQIGDAIEFYTVQFQNDRLVYADREWFLAKGDLDAFEKHHRRSGVGRRQ